MEEETDRGYLRTRRDSKQLPPDMSEPGVHDEAGLTVMVKPRRNLVLFGSRGEEKTSAAEAILGQTDLHPASRQHQGEVHGRWVSVLEMPPLYEKPHEEVMEESFSCVSLCDPEGVHAFILILPVGPLTDEDKRELQTIQDTFSSRVKDFSMILFTVESDPADPAVVNFVQKNKDIQDLCQSCGGRSVVLNITDKKQIPELLETVEKMCSEGSKCFTKDTFTQANIERISKLQSELQDVKQKMEKDCGLIEQLEEREEEMKKKHKEVLKTLKEQVDQERKKRVQQLKEKDENMEKEREKMKKEREDEDKRRKKQEDAQRQEWKQKLEASEQKVQSEKIQRENVEKKLDQCRREMKRDRDVRDKEKDQFWERVHQEQKKNLEDVKKNLEDVKKNLEEEKISHRKLQEEYNWKRKKWIYPWMFVLPVSMFLLFHVLTTQTWL